MQRTFTFRGWMGIAFCLVFGFLVVSTSSRVLASTYSLALRRYPYLTDAVGSYATINWATDRSESTGAVRYGKVGSEACTAHYVAGTKSAISINGVLAYQWKAQLNLEPNAQYCYRVYLGTSPAGEIDLLGSDASPSFWTQVASGATAPFSFIVLGDWGSVDSSGANPSQANLMSLMATSGARFAVTAGDNGYPAGSQTNYGDLIQTGANISAIFGPSFWKVPGASLPLFMTQGNHGFSSSDTFHPALITWPEDRAVSTSGGRYQRDTYCCLDGTTSASYPSAWYAFDAGPARFYVLNAAWSDTNIGTADKYQVDYDYHWAPGTPQYQWLQADLAAHSSVLKFAFLHFPIYSDSPSETSDTFLQGSSSVEGLLKANGVDIAFTGHAHIYERNLASAAGVINYIAGGGGAPLGSLGTCTSLDAYAIKFTTTGKACGSAPVPTSADQVFHFLKVTVNGTSVTVTPINALGQSFDVMNYSFISGKETTPPSTPTNLTATVASGTQINLSWSASTDNTAVRGYDIYRDGELINTVDASTLSYSDTSVHPATTYSYQVDAFDGSGNHSALSTSRSATTIGTASYTFVAVADAYVSDGSPTSNFGLTNTLRADGSPDFHSYLRFNVGDLSGTVTRATLRLYTTSSSATGYQIKRVGSQNWEEATITFANAPTVGALIGSSGNIAANNWTSVDVTSLVTGNGIYDLALTNTTTTNFNFNSREAASNPPQLVVETTTTSGGATPTPSVTATVTVTPSQTPTAGPVSTLTFTALADAKVSEASPTTNFGTATTLLVDGGTGVRQNGYIRFSASGITGTIQNVKLRVFSGTDGTANGPAAYLADNNWIESGTGGVTWNTQPALLSAAFDNKGTIATSTWVEYDVTPLVSGDGTYTFALVADSTDGVNFSSREGATPPQLVVTFAQSPTATPTVASNTPTVTLTPSLTPTITNTPTVTNTPSGSGNLVLNPGFEAQGAGGVTDASDWIEGTNHARASDKFHTGGWSLHSTYRGAGTATSTANPIAVSPNTTYTYSGYIWRTDSIGGACLDMSDILGETQLCTSASGSWQFLTGTWNSGSNTSVTLRLVTDGSPTGDIWFDDISLVGPGNTPTSTNALLATDTPTPTATLTPTPTTALVATDTSTPTPTDTNVPAATDTVTPTSTNPPAATDTPTFTSTPTNALVATDTPTETATPTSTTSPADTDTPTFTPTATDSSAVTDTPTATPSFTPTASNTPAITDTPTATLTPSFTATASQTLTSTNTATLTPIATNTPTATLTPSFTATASQTLTATNTATLTPIATNTSTATVTPSFTATASQTLTPTNTATLTPTATNTPTATPTATAGSPTVLTLTTVADARVVQTSPTTNFGTSTNLQSDLGSTDSQTSFIRFTITGVSGTIQSVKLRVFCTTNATVNGPAAYLANNNWIESGTGGVTWNTQPPLLSGAFDNKGAIATSTWVEYNVTPLVTGNGTYTFALVADNADGVTFSSREGASPPQLVVTYGP